MGYWMHKIVYSVENNKIIQMYSLYCSNKSENKKYSILFEESRIRIRYFVVTMMNIFYGYNHEITIIFTIDQSKIK